MWTSRVWPPETSSTTSGSSRSGSSRNAAYRWPSRWLTATKGTSHTRARALAALRPTSSEPTRPGPDVAATASTSWSATPASTSASATTGVSSSTWARLAISGTTPPYLAWRSIWLATTDDRTRVARSTTAAAVSSHDVSMPRITSAMALAAYGPRASSRTGVDRSRAPHPIDAGRGSEPVTFDDGAAGYVDLDLVQAIGIVRGVDVVGPHDEGVLAGLGVVALAHACRQEAEALVQRLRPRVAHAHLEGEVAAAPLDRRPGQRQQHPGGDAVALPLGVDGHRGDVAVVDRPEQPGVAHDLGPHARDQVHPGGPLADLAEEQAERPWPGVDLLLDPQDAPEVSPPHRRDAHLELRRIGDGRREGPGHHPLSPPSSAVPPPALLGTARPPTAPSRVIQLISASGRRR